MVGYFSRVCGLAGRSLGLRRKDAGKRAVARAVAEGLEGRMMLAGTAAAYQMFDASPAVDSFLPAYDTSDNASSDVSATKSSALASNFRPRPPNATFLKVTINQVDNQANTTSLSPINFTVVFSAPVSDFSAEDVDVSGTAEATTVRLTGSGTTYNVAVSGMAHSGTVIASIPEGVASSPSVSGANLSSTSTNNIVYYFVPAFNFDAEYVSVNESQKYVEITVTRIGDCLNAASVNCKSSRGSAKAGADYKLVAGTLKFPVGRATRTFKVRIINDTVAEIDKTVNLVLSHPTGGTILGAASRAVLTIMDDDDHTAPTAKMGKVVNGATTMKFPVTYTDNLLVSCGYIDSGDILVTGPKGFSQLASVVSAQGRDVKSLTVVYRVPAPGGTWDKADNGTYSFWLQGNQISDRQGNAAARKQLGSQKVAFTSPTPSEGGYGVRLSAVSSWGYWDGYKHIYGVATIKIDGRVVKSGPQGVSYSTCGPQWTFYPSGTVLEISVSDGFLTGGSEIYINDPRTGRSQSLFSNATMTNKGPKIVRTIP